MGAVLRVLSAGENVFVFDADDEAFDLQYMVCVGATLDVERWTIPASNWDETRARLAALSGVEIIDCRREQSSPIRPSRLDAAPANSR